MDSIIQKLGNSMISKFCEKVNQYTGTDQFIYPWRENRVPMKDMTPYSGRLNCEYVSKDSLYHRIGHQDKHTFAKLNLEFQEWVPQGCYPLIKYCSGHYNHPDIIWKLEKRKQILLLASELKDPNDFERSTWHKFITDISERVQGFAMSDPNISHSTVKEVVDFLHHICKVVNYEINFIEAKLTNAAERNISTYAFAFAFKSILNTKIDLQKESKSKENERKQNNLKYFLQKVENQKLARGNFDRKERRKGDKAIASKYAEDLLAAVWRGVNADCEQSIADKYFRGKKDQISHKSILLLANEKITEELNHDYTSTSRNNPIDEDNIIIQYTCNRTHYLKKIFKEEWLKIVKELQDEIVRNMRDTFTEQIATLKHVLAEFLERLVAKRKALDRFEDIGSDSDSNFEVADNIVEAKQTPHNSESKMRDAPLKAMVFFLKQYLDPNVNPEEFNKQFNDDFEVNGIKMKKIHQKFVLSEKEHNPAQELDEEMFRKLKESNMFSSTETIFNIKVYIQEFFHSLTCYEYKVTEVEYEQMLNSTREKFEADVINCPHQCPSCGKFCEREIHPNGGKCRIMTGHQICSMGGNVWNNNEDITAILLMCDDYNDDTPVLIPGQNMKWWEFKEKCGDQWDWTLPTEEKYVTLQENNRNRMEKIWNKYGREILNFYANRGITITYIPYTYPLDIYRSLFSPNYYICFVIDGTVEACSNLYINTVLVQSIIEVCSDLGTLHSRVIIYHGHGVENRKCIEYFPDEHGFTSDGESVQNFVEKVQTYGEGDEYALLDGLASATTGSDWKSGLGIMNEIQHYYVEPTNGYFNVFTAEGKCVGCPFDWKRDVRDKMEELNIRYDKSRTIKRTHPDYDPDPHYKVRSNSDFKRIQVIPKKTQIVINYKTDK